MEVLILFEEKKGGGGEKKKEKKITYIQGNNILFTLFIKILKNTRKSFLPHKMKSPHQDH